MPRQWKERRATPGAWQLIGGKWHRADAAGVWRVSAEPPRARKGGLGV